MGGASVAVGNSRQAHYYNPSLLDNAPQDQDFNIEFDAAIRIADSDRLIDSLKQFEKDNPLTTFKTEIESLSSNPDSLSKLITTAENLQQNIQRITNRSLTLDANLGLFASVPNRYISWAIYTNTWTNVGITGTLGKRDNMLINTFIQTSKEYQLEGTLSPETIQQLKELDPTKQNPAELASSLESSISTQGALIFELGAALAMTQKVNSYVFEIGITPKIQKVTTFGYEQTLKKLENADNLIDTEITKTFTVFNFDLGISKRLDENWKTGIVIKNLIPRTFDIKNVESSDVTIAPAMRIGTAFVSNWFSAGIDLDLTQNNDIATQSRSRFLAIGAEFDVWLLQLRGGYRHNFASAGGGGPSAGFGLYLFGLNIDAAVASNSFYYNKITNADNINASLQLGANW